MTEFAEAADRRSERDSDRQERKRERQVDRDERKEERLVHEFCPAHSGLEQAIQTLSDEFVRKAAIDREEANRMWQKLDEALKRWPMGATVAVSVMSGVCGLIIGSMGMFVRMGGVK